MTKQIAAISVSVLAITFGGCGRSKQREASIGELVKVQAAFRDLQIAVNAGVTKQEFSQRTNDALVKIGDLQGSQSRAEKGFAAEKDKVDEIYAHFRRAAQAYTLSKQFFGANLDANSEFEVDRMTDSEWDLLMDAYPNLVETGYFAHFHSRSETLQDLWKIAASESKLASGLVDQLRPPD